MADVKDIFSATSVRVPGDTDDPLTALEKWAEEGRKLRQTRWYGIRRSGSHVHCDLQWSHGGKDWNVRKVERIAHHAVFSAMAEFVKWERGIARQLAEGGPKDAGTVEEGGRAGEGR